MEEKIICVLTAIFAIMGIGFTIFPGTSFTGILSFALALAAAVWLILRRWARKSNIGQICKNLFCIGLTIGVILFCVLEAIIIFFGKEDPDCPVDAVIVLGAGVNGETPSLALQSRIDRAIVYLREHENIPVVLSGGQGVNEDISEAEAMRRAMLAQGIDESRIFLEDKSTSTAENLRYSELLLESYGYNLYNRPVAIVTNRFHLFRAKLLNYNGIPIGVSAPLPTWIALHCYIREVFALAKSLVFDYNFGK